MHAKNIGKYFKHCMQLPRKKMLYHHANNLMAAKLHYLKVLNSSSFINSKTLELTIKS